MKLLSIDGQMLYNMIVSASNSLENNKLSVNALNVFPVPDGDTGTNMSMTMTSASKEVQRQKIRTVENIAEAASMGSLMGARGNSGVILSQLLRGFAKGAKGKDLLDSKSLAAAMKEGVNTAYKAVMKPTEGTILTVARESADKAVELSKSIDDIILFMDKVYEYAEAVLQKTPDMLPVLKKAGVVDAGGKGLMHIYEGMIKALKGKDVIIEEYSLQEEPEVTTQGGPSTLEEEIKFGYCTEFIIKNATFEADVLKDTLSEMGDSLIVVGASGVIKVHVHTNDPGKVLSKAIEIGELSKIKIDNMREQHRSILEEGNSEPVEPADDEDHEINDESLSPQKAGVITVTMGDGLKNIFLDLGAQKVIEGGQTMNPSTEDILKAINSVNAQDIYILPNNGNIVMAAKQAAALSDKNVIVIPTKSIPQGIAALTAFNPESESNENTEAMSFAIKYVKTGQVTYAVRKTSFDDKDIDEGDILGLMDGKIISTGKDVNGVVQSTIDNMVSEDDELITMFYGSDISEDEAKKLADSISEKYEDCEVQLYYGGQPLYYYIISVE